MRISNRPDPSVLPCGIDVTGHVPVGTHTHVWPFVAVGRGTRAAVVAGGVAGITGRLGGKVEITGGNTGMPCRSSPFMSVK